MLTESLKLMTFVMSDELGVSCMSRRYLVGSRFDTKERNVRHRVQYCAALKVAKIRLLTAKHRINRLAGKQEQQLEKHASNSTYS